MCVCVSDKALGRFLLGLSVLNFHVIWFDSYASIIPNVTRIQVGPLPILLSTHTTHMKIQ